MAPDAIHAQKSIAVGLGSPVRILLATRNAHPPANCPTQLVYGIISLAQADRLVLGADLNRSESEPITPSSQSSGQA